MSLHFVITLCIRNEVHLRQALRCLDSIRQFHQDPIYILNDTEKDFFETIQPFFVKYDNVKFLPAYKKGLGELQVFSFIMNFSEIQENDNVVYLHDSTIMFSPFHETINVQELQFIWYYTHHRLHWDGITQPQTPYNIENNIHTHTDLIAHYLKKHYTDNQTFLSWALDSLKNKEKYVGCFGLMCVLKKQSLRKLNETVPFINKFMEFSTRMERVINEDIFSLICNYFYSMQHCIQSYDGLYFDPIENYYRSKHTPVYGIEDPLTWSCKGDRLGKISFER